MFPHNASSGHARGDSTSGTAANNHNINNYNAQSNNNNNNNNNPNNNKNKNNNNNKIGATSVIGYLEQQKLIQELQMKLQERDDACFELSATLATVRAETAYEIKSIQTQTQQELSKTNEALRRAQQEANIAQHKIQNLQQQQAKQQQSLQQQTPTSSSATIFSSSSFSKSIDSNRMMIASSEGSGNSGNRSRTIKTPPSSTTGNNNKHNHAEVVIASSTTNTTTTQSTTPKVSTNTNNSFQFPQQQQQQQSVVGCQQLALHLLEVFSMTLSSSSSAFFFQNDTTHHTTNEYENDYIRNLIQHAAAASSSSSNSRISNTTTMTESDFIWQLLQQCHKLLQQQQQQQYDKDGSDVLNTDVMHNANHENVNNNINNNNNNDNKENHGKKKQQEKDDVIMEDIVDDKPHQEIVVPSLDTTLTNNDTTTGTNTHTKNATHDNDMEENDNDNDEPMIGLKRQQDHEHLLLETKKKQNQGHLLQHLQCLYEALKWSHQGRNAIIMALCCSTDTVPSSTGTTFGSDNPSNITTNDDDDDNDETHVVNNISHRIRFSKRKQMKKYNHKKHPTGHAEKSDGDVIAHSAVLPTQHQQDIFFHQLLQAKHELQEPLYNGGSSRTSTYSYQPMTHLPLDLHHTNKKKKNMYWTLPHQQQSCQTFVQTLMTMIRNDWQTAQPNQVVYKALQIIQLLLLDNDNTTTMMISSHPQQPSLPLSKEEEDDEEMKDASSTPTNHDRTTVTTTLNVHGFIFFVWEGLFPPCYKTQDHQQKQHYRKSREKNVIDSFLEPCVNSWLTMTSFPRRHWCVGSCQGQDNDDNDCQAISMNIDETVTGKKNEDDDDNSLRRSKRKNNGQAFNDVTTKKEHHDKPGKENIKHDMNTRKRNNNNNNKATIPNQKQYNTNIHDSSYSDRSLPTTTATISLDRIPELTLTFSILSRLMACSDRVRSQLLQENDGKLGKQAVALVLDVLEGLIGTPVGGYGDVSSESEQRQQQQGLRHLSPKEEKLIVELIRWLQILCRTNMGLDLLRSQILVETAILTIQHHQQVSSNMKNSRKKNHNKDQQQPHRMSPDTNRAPSGIAVTVRMLHYAATAATSSGCNNYLHGRIIVESVRLLHLILHHTQQQREISESKDPPQQPPYTFSGLLVEDKEFYKAACAMIFALDEETNTELDVGSNYHPIFSHDGDSKYNGGDIPHLGLDKFVSKLLKIQLEELAMDELEEEETLAKRITSSGEITIKRMLQDP